MSDAGPIVVLPTTLPNIPGARNGTNRGWDWNDRFRVFRSEVLRALRQVPSVAQTLQGIAAQKQYVIEWPEGIEQALKSGSATWKQRADGAWPVVVRDAEEKNIVKHLRLRDGDVPTGMWTGLSQMATQSALSELAAKLEEIDAKLDRLLSAKRADRYGQVDAAAHLIEQAGAANDDSRRVRLLEDALRALAEARGKLLRDIQQEAGDLRAPTLWMLLLRSLPFAASPSEKLAKRVMDVTEDLEATFVATRMMTQIHSELGEPEMARVAIRQLADGLRPTTTKMIGLARFVDRTVTQDPEPRWLAIEERLLPAAERGSAVLGDIVERKPVGMLVSGAELLEGAH